MAELLQEAKAQGKSLSEIRAFLSPPSSPDYSDDRSERHETRAEKTREYAKDDPERNTESRKRTVSVGDKEIRTEAKTYLRDRYTKDYQILYCQICKKAMPFKLSDDSYYFEAVELIKDGEQWHKQNFIALCPTDAAKFKHANESKDSIEASIKVLIARTKEEINNSQDTDNFCHVKLAGNTETLTFSPIHLLDLKAIMMAG